MNTMLGKEYINFLAEIKSRIVTARIQAIRSVNKELIKLYWDIGRVIVDRQKKYKWGNNIVEALARDLKDAFPQVHGFSERNVWNMRRVYEEYKNKPFLQQLVAEIPWGHNLLIMEKVSGDKEREYYIKSSRDLGWSRNVLLNQIKARAYEFTLKQKTHNFPKALPVHLAEQADESIKSVYNLDFLDITKSVIERRLERGKTAGRECIKITDTRGIKIRNPIIHPQRQNNRCLGTVILFHRKVQYVPFWNTLFP